MSRKCVLMLITQTRPHLELVQIGFHLCLALQKGPVLPTIIIDEANQLQQWKKTEETQLDALLRFFVLVTKEAKLAHVVLATSESIFEYWLSESTLLVQPYSWQSLSDCVEQLLLCTLPNMHSNQNSGVFQE